MVVKPKRLNLMETKQEIQKETRLKLEQRGWVFKKKSTYAVCANQLRLTVIPSYMYSYSYMQEVWCDLCVAFGLKKNYDLHPRTEDNFIPGGKGCWRLLAVDMVKGVKFYEHKQSKHRIDYERGK